MNYAEQTEKSDLSCEGCCFNRELFTTKYKEKGKEWVAVGRESKHQWACYAPSEEPYKSCKERHVIFTLKTD